MLYHKTSPCTNQRRHSGLATLLLYKHLYKAFKVYFKENWFSNIGENTKKNLINSSQAARLQHGHCPLDKSYLIVIGKKKKVCEEMDNREAQDIPNNLEQEGS